MARERDNIREVVAYTPGEQPESADVVKLNTNENPYPPSEAVMRAIAAVPGESLRRYPSPIARRFREVAGQVHGLTPEHVIATNGGDELLRMLIAAYCEPHGTFDGNANATGGMGVAEPTYSLYKVLAKTHGTPYVALRRGDDFALPERFADRLNHAGCRLAFIVNPHAPTGRLESVETLEAIARTFQGVLVIDEAYVDFANHDALPLLDPARGLDNVVLLRSLSKGYSLAGLRFGYGLGSPSLIAVLDKVRDSYNTDAVAQAAAIAALESRDAAAETWQKVVAERTRLTAELTRRGFHVLPSHTNFVLAKPPVDAANLYESLKAKQIFVRYFDHDGLRDRLRISVGTPAQNDALLAAIDSESGTTDIHG